MGKMIRVLLVLSLGLLLATSAFAKDAYEPGNFYLSGATDLNFAMGTDTFTPDEGDGVDTDHTVFGLGTRAGYFVIEGLEIGLGFEYDYDKATTEFTTVDDQGVATTMDVDTITSSYLIGLQAAYFYNLGGIDPFLAFLIGFGGQSTDVEPEEGDSTANSASGLAYDIALGVNFLLNSKVGLAPALYYRGLSFSGTDDSSGEDADYDWSSSRFGLRVGINCFL